MDDLRSYLATVEQMMALSGDPVEGAEYRTICGFVHARGRPYHSEALTDEEMRWLFELIDGYGCRFPVKQCFTNAQRLLLHHRDSPAIWDQGMKLRYVEGYAYSLLPIHHGWLALNGKVVDLTLRVARENQLSRKSTEHRRRLRDRVLGEFGAPRQYYGIELAAELVRARVVRTGAWGTLIDEWESGWPLLRNLGTQPAEPEGHEQEEEDEGHEPATGSPAEDGGPGGDHQGAGGLLSSERGREQGSEIVGGSEADPHQLEEPPAAAEGEGGGDP